MSTHILCLRAEISKVMYTSVTFSFMGDFLICNFCRLFSHQMCIHNKIKSSLISQMKLSCSENGQIHFRVEGVLGDINFLFFCSTILENPIIKCADCEQMSYIMWYLIWFCYICQC